MVKSCKYCGTEIPSELLNTINIGESLTCENCGVKIIKERDETIEIDNRIDDNNQANGFFHRVNEKLRNKKSPIDRILGDSDFPLIFIENYIIVAFRIIYFHFLEMKKDLEFDFQKGELTEEIVEILYKKIKPITEKGIMPEFLKNLKKLSIKRFEKWLEYQQSKVEASEKYSKDFAFFLKWLIEKVFIIISDLWSENNLPKSDRIIRDDLRTFEYNLNSLCINSSDSGLFWDNNSVQKENLTKNLQNLNAQRYRNEVFEYIVKHAFTLNSRLERKLNELFRTECIQMYDDILFSIPCKNENKRFIFFYQSFGPRNIKNANYVATSLIFFNFARLGIKFKRKLLVHLLSLSLSSFNRVCSTISSHLKKIPKYDYILELINANMLTEDEYFALTNKYINRYITYLNGRNFDNINFSGEDYDQITNLLWNIIDSIEGVNKFQIFFERLKKKKPKILAAVMCFICLKYEKDINLKKGYFLDLLLENNNFYMPRTNFTEVLHQIMLDFFELDQEKYQKKVGSYLTQYLAKLESYFSFDLRVDKDDLIEKVMAIFDYASVNNFLILDINKNNEIDYYFPQDFAFSLLYFTFKKTKGLEDLATPVKLEQCFGSEFSFKHLNDRSGNRLYDYIADDLGRYKGQTYSRGTFIKMMRKSLQEFYHIESYFLLELYQSLEMEPKEFGDNLYIHNTPGTSGILRVIRKKTSFSDPNTFENIRKFIRTNHRGYYKRYFIDWINAIQDLKRKDFRHQSVTYPFRWKEERLNIINNNQLRLGLDNFFNDLWEEKFPRDIFTSNDNPRASMLKFYGSYDEHLKFEYIEDFFKDELKTYDSSFFLCKYVQEVFKHYKKNRIGKKPDHPPILAYIITNDNNTIAIESPVWKPIKNSDLFNIGHIDIILFRNDSLIIADYKPDEDKIYRSLPQLTAYGILLKDRLEDYGVHINNNILCIGFSKDVAYSFNPEYLYPKLLQFVKITNSNRNSCLLSRKVPKISKRTDLYNDLKRLK